MKRRLLIDSTVLEFVGRLRKRDRDFLSQRFEQIREFPDDHADYQEAGESGRMFDTTWPVVSPFRIGMTSRIAI